MVHRDQKRKFTELPYILHPVAVAEHAAEMASCLGFGGTEQTRCYHLGLLHDTWEDGGDEDRNLFDTREDIGFHKHDVLVLSKNGQKLHAYNAGIYRANRYVQCVKLADISCNLRDTELTIHLMAIEKDRKWLKKWVVEKLEFLAGWPDGGGDDIFAPEIDDIEKRLRQVLWVC